MKNLIELVGAQHNIDEMLDTVKIILDELNALVDFRREKVKFFEQCSYKEIQHFWNYMRHPSEKRENISKEDFISDYTKKELFRFIVLRSKVERLYHDLNNNTPYHQTLSDTYMRLNAVFDTQQKGELILVGKRIASHNSDKLFSVDLIEDLINKLELSLSDANKKFLKLIKGELKFIPGAGTINIVNVKEIFIEIIKELSILFAQLNEDPGHDSTQKIARNIANIKQNIKLCTVEQEEDFLQILKRLTEIRQISVKPCEDERPNFDDENINDLFVACHLITELNIYQKRLADISNSITNKRKTVKINKAKKIQPKTIIKADEISEEIFEHGEMLELRKFEDDVNTTIIQPAASAAASESYPKSTILRLATLGSTHRNPHHRESYSRVKIDRELCRLSEGSIKELIHAKTYTFTELETLIKRLQGKIEFTRGSHFKILINNRVAAYADDDELPLSEHTKIGEGVRSHGRDKSGTFTRTGLKSIQSAIISVLPEGFIDELQARKVAAKP